MFIKANNNYINSDIISTVRVISDTRINIYFTTDEKELLMTFKSSAKCREWMGNFLRTVNGV